MTIVNWFIEKRIWDCMSLIILAAVILYVIKAWCFLRLLLWLGSLITWNKILVTRKNWWARFPLSLLSLSNHDDDSNKNPTNLHIWQWKIVFLHALHVHFPFFDILETFSFFLRRGMTCFAVVWTTWAYDDKCSILCSYVRSTGYNLIPGQLEHTFQA